MSLELDGILERLESRYRPTKTVTFDDGLTVHLATLDPAHEIIITEYIKNLEGIAYFEGLKVATLAYSIYKINDIELPNNKDIEIDTPEGKKKIQKHLYLRGKIEKWHSSLRNELFRAYENLQLEVEAYVKESVKFKQFELPKVATEQQKEEKLKEVKSKPEMNTESPKINMKDADLVNDIIENEREAIESGMINQE